MKFLNYEGLGHLIEEIKAKFVQKASGKDLSTNDFNDLYKDKVDGIEENANKYVHPEKHLAGIITETNDKQFIDKTRKDKLDGIEADADKNKIELIQRNGTNLPITSKSVNIAVPTKLSDLTNDETFQTRSEIISLISDKGKLKKEIVTALPSVASADDNTMYLIASASGTGYAEWMLINNKFEKLGDTGSIDLTGYVKESDITIITKEQIDAMFNA